VDIEDRGGGDQDLGVSRDRLVRPLRRRRRDGGEPRRRDERGAEEADVRVPLNVAEAIEDDDEGKLGLARLHDRARGASVSSG